MKSKSNIDPKTHKITTESNKQKQTKQNNKKKTQFYLQLSNQQFLRRNLKLLGVTEPSFFKQTKASIESQFFPKHQTNPTSSKQFFYISLVCMQNLTTIDQLKEVKIWYPPRNVNQQIEYKKAFFKSIQNLQLLGRVPKNLLISKGTIMGDTTSAVLLQFLRFLSELALRFQFLQRFSKKEKLIQICCNNQGSNIQNNINKFYIHPFVPSVNTHSFQHQSVNIDLLKQVYHDYLKIYLKRIIKLKTTNIEPVISEKYLDMIKKLLSQKQLSQTLSQKIPSAVVSQNRAFDRRRLILRNEQIWQQMNRIECNYIEVKEVPTLKLEGEVDQIFRKWEPVKGVSNIIQANSFLKTVPQLSQSLKKQRSRFRQLSLQLQYIIDSSS